MALQFKQTAHESKPLFAEIDIGAKKLILVIRKNDTSFKAQKFTNAPADRARLVKKLANLPSIIVAWKPSITSICPSPSTAPVWRSCWSIRRLLTTLSRR